MNGDRRLFGLFSDPTRRRLLRLVARRAVCVCDLIDAVRLPQPTVSRHLSALQKAGLVRVERRGRWRHYSAAAPRGALARGLVACALAERDAQGDARRLARRPRSECV